MKKQFLFLAIIIVALSSCNKEKNDPQPPIGESKVAIVDATSKTAWNYYSFAQNKIIGSAEESLENSATWGARKDWDIALRQFNIRTNSGEFTTVGGKGGVFIFKTAIADGGIYYYDEKNPFSSLLKMPTGIEFVQDKAVTYETHGGGFVTTIQSHATVFSFRLRWNDKTKDWELEMPPVYLKAPLSIFRSADGEKCYKVEFTQYKDENNVSGRVIFNYAQIK